MCTLNSFPRLIFPTITCAWHFFPDVMYITPSKAPSQMASLHRGEATAAWSSLQRRALEHGWHSCAEFIHGQTEKRTFLAAVREGRVYQWIEVNIQRKLGLPPCFVGLFRFSDFSLVFLLEDWK